MILQACYTDSIARAAIAIGALDHDFAVNEDCRSLHFDKKESTITPHHKNAFRQYAKALSIMKSDVSEGRQDLRTTLITCLVIIVFESFHGNYGLADRQIQTAVHLIRDWRSSQPNNKDHAIGFSSPAPDVLEDGIIQIFGRLELHAVSLPRLHVWSRKEGARHIEEMPDVFQSTSEARNYIELIVRRARHWLYFIKQNLPQVSRIEFKNSTLGPPELHSDHSWGPTDEIYPLDKASLFKQRKLHFFELSRWGTAFAALLRRYPKLDNEISVISLRLASKSLNVVLKTALAEDDTVFDTVALGEVHLSSNWMMYQKARC